MNDAPDSASDHRTGDWQSAAAEFLQARLDLVRHEARLAGRQAARRAATAVFVTGCAVSFWILTIAGLIGLVASARPDWAWHHVALATGGLHLLAGILGLLYLRKPGATAFPLTRSEFAKDQAWLETLKTKR